MYHEMPLVWEWVSVIGKARAKMVKDFEIWYPDTGALIGDQWKTLVHDVLNELKKGGVPIGSVKLVKQSGEAIPQDEVDKIRTEGFEPGGEYIE